jgi:glyoxylase-like metal-dependent hydrolase (beta-lactamase superfamily II)
MGQVLSRRARDETAAESWRVRGLVTGYAPEMTDISPQQVAPGVYRVADGLVNWYIVRDGSELMIVDAGWPRSWGTVESALGAIGASAKHLGTVLLTHGHPDHLGAAEHARRNTGAQVWAYRGEVERVRGKSKGASPFTLVPGLAPTLWRPSALGFVLHATARGFMTPKWVSEVNAFDAGAPLDLPGRPDVILTPGHTPGHVSFRFGEAGVLVTGDAIASLDVLSRDTGPRLLPDALNNDPAATRASLEQLEGVDAGTMLFGHGEPFAGAPREAVARAREASV